MEYVKYRVRLNKHPALSVEYRNLLEEDLKECVYHILRGMRLLDINIDFCVQHSVDIPGITIDVINKDKEITRRIYIDV